ncbi:DUF4340 domain-containing protein [Thermoleptolyngbya sichuanensis XZ-Cy5]|uniref:DUF4340 domain-containing protein n=1 Tax=Thermoleptolyngbya sichuanensis TaxID=2885951 RepID=UPI00240E56D7|nr:DUF4340 domain-containing protein [Thermoleptolyngbya sichuanensis]MDG2616880.1 DUF4340 domain-containing protein [Thermoleptolyngbya sichuanensis XZ-Cy5]
MKLKPATFWLLFAALILGSVSLWSLQQPPRTEEAGQTTPQKLFAIEESQIQSLTVKKPNETLLFEKDENGVWQMKQPQQGVANDAAVAFLANLLATGMSDRTFSIPPTDLATYGLDQPSTTIEFTANGKSHTLALGNKNFNQSAIYALIDAPENPQNLTVSLVSLDFETAVGRSPHAWLQPTPAASPSPSPAE